MPCHSQTRVRPLALVLVLAAVPGLFVHSASAEQNKRGTRRATPPVSPTRAAPDVTGTIKGTRPPNPAPMTPAPKADDDEGPLKPFDLPTAPRARMRQCGETWQKIKLSGQAGDRTWREFATGCLTERAAQPDDVGRTRADKHQDLVPAH